MGTCGTVALIGGVALPSPESCKIADLLGEQRGGLKMCLTAGIKRENAGVTLVACAADNKAQQWRFTRAPPVGLTPSGKFIDAPPCIST